MKKTDAVQSINDQQLIFNKKKSWEKPTLIKMSIDENTLSGPGDTVENSASFAGS
jgi:hypothetical protein